METIYHFQDHILKNVDVVLTWGLALAAFSALIAQ